MRLFVAVATREFSRKVVGARPYGASFRDVGVVS